MVPGYEAIEGISARDEFHIDGPSTRPADRDRPGPGPRCAAAAQRQLADDELRLMTIRSEEQFNTVVYEEEDLYRGRTVATSS